MDILGGAYRDVKGRGGNGHHVFAWSAYSNVLNMSHAEGPAVAMSVIDHSKTASYDNRQGSADYRNQQRELLSNGHFQEAWHRDVADARSKFGDKYDQHFAQAEAQLLKLDAQNKIKLEESFKNEIHQRQQLQADLQRAQKQDSQAEIAARKEALKSSYDKTLSERAAQTQGAERAQAIVNQNERDKGRDATLERARASIQGDRANVQSYPGAEQNKATKESGQAEARSQESTYARAHQAILGRPASAEACRSVEANSQTTSQQQNNAQAQSQTQSQTQSQDEQQRGR
jgi:hypothetical protein